MSLKQCSDGDVAVSGASSSEGSSAVVDLLTLPVRNSWKGVCLVWKPCMIGGTAVLCAYAGYRLWKYFARNSQDYDLEGDDVPEEDDLRVDDKWCLPAGSQWSEVARDAWYQEDVPYDPLYGTPPWVTRMQTERNGRTAIRRANALLVCSYICPVEVKYVGVEKIDQISPEEEKVEKTCTQKTDIPARVIVTDTCRVDFDEVRVEDVSENSEKKRGEDKTNTHETDNLSLDPEFSVPEGVLWSEICPEIVDVVDVEDVYRISSEKDKVEKETDILLPDPDFTVPAGVLWSDICPEVIEVGVADVCQISVSEHKLSETCTQEKLSSDTEFSVPATICPEEMNGTNVDNTHQPEKEEGHWCRWRGSCMPGKQEV